MINNFFPSPHRFRTLRTLALGLPHDPTQRMIQRPASLQDGPLPNTIRPEVVEHLGAVDVGSQDRERGGQRIRLEGRRAVRLYGGLHHGQRLVDRGPVVARPVLATAERPMVLTIDR